MSERNDMFDAMRYSLFAGTPSFVEPVKINIPQPSAYEAIKKLVDDYDKEKEKADREWRIGDYKFQYHRGDSIGMVYEPPEEEEKEKEMKNTIIKEIGKMADRYDLIVEYTIDNYHDSVDILFISKNYQNRKSFRVVFTLIQDLGKALERIEYELIEAFHIDLNKFEPVKVPRIEDVIYNVPAIIVFWEDGTKTVVKCQEGDIYDPEKGLAMAISKKALGNQGNYCNVFKKWLPEEEEPVTFAISKDAFGTITGDK